MNILIIEHPKCGRHWLANILSDIGVKVHLTHAGSGATRRIKYDMIHPREYFSGGYKNSSVKNKIFLYREPKDVMVSFYNQVKYRCNQKKIDNKVTENMFIFIRSIYGIEYLLKFYKLWEKYVDEEKILSISYENLHYDTIGSIKKIIDYMKFYCDNEAIIKSIENNVFEKTKKREKKANPNLPLKRFHSRKGIIGDYKNNMNIEDIEYCNFMIEKYKSKFI